MKNTSFKILDEIEKKRLVDFLAMPDIAAMLKTLKEEDAEDDNVSKGLVVSTEHVDRMGEIVRQDGINTDMYMKNPVVLNSHNYNGIDNIVGMATKLYSGVVDGAKATLADVRWAPTVNGQTAKTLHKGKFLSANSIGFIPEEFDKDDKSIITKSQMLEFSVVPVPANGYATRQEGVKMLAALGLTEDELRTKGFDIKIEPTGEAEVGDECSMEDGTLGTFTEGEGGKLVCVPKQDAMKEKGAVPYADHGIAPEDTKWDGPAQVKACGEDMDKLKSICAWFDPEEKDKKSGYKLPHHEADGLKAVWNGVKAAMGAIMGARGGAKIDDKKGVYEHLAKHYAQFKKDAPDFEKAMEIAKSVEALGVYGDLSSDFNGKTFEFSIEKTSPVTGGDNDPAEESMWEDLKAETSFHDTALKSHIKEYVAAKKAEDDKEPDADADDEAKKAFRAARLKTIEDHEKKLKTVLKAEHERHMKGVDEVVKAYKENSNDDDSDDQSGEHDQDDHDIDNEKMVAAVKSAFPLATDEQIAAVVKSGRTLSRATHEKLKAICDSMSDGTDIHTKAIDEFKSLLAEHEPTEGDEAPKGDPEKRSIPVELMSNPELLRALNTATREALEKINFERSGKRAR